VVNSELKKLSVPSGVGVVVILSAHVRPLVNDMLSLFSLDLLFTATYIDVMP
jgi:hypothetical protein